MTKEETLFQRRLLDLANMADQRNIGLFSDFLSLNELNIYHSSKKELGFVTCRLFGGYEAAERQMIAFIPDALSYDMADTEPEGIRNLRIGREYPFCLHPHTYRCMKNMRYKLTHRRLSGCYSDISGLKRSKIGDILLTDDGTYIVFRHEHYGRAALSGN